MQISERSLKLYDRALASVSSIAIIVGGIWTVWGLKDSRDKESETKREQIRFAIFNEKKLVYYELCEAAAEIANCAKYDEVLIAQKHFVKLYLAKAHIIQELDSKVGDQKVKFMALLMKYLKDKPKETPYEYFSSDVLDLSTVCKANLKMDSIYEAH